MSEITFKATRRLHESGFRVLEKDGALEYDLCDTQGDVIWLTVTAPQSIKIDCLKDGTYRLIFDKNKAYLHGNPAPNQQDKEKI